MTLSDTVIVFYCLQGTERQKNHNNLYNTVVDQHNIFYKKKYSFLPTVPNHYLHQLVVNFPAICVARFSPKKEQSVFTSNCTSHLPHSHVQVAPKVLKQILN
jgi:hypothetical protein